MTSQNVTWRRGSLRIAVGEGWVAEEARPQTVIQTLQVSFPSRRHPNHRPAIHEVEQLLVVDSGAVRGKDLSADAALKGFRLNFVGQDHHLRTIQAEMSARVEVVHEGPHETVLKVTTLYTSLLRDDHRERPWSTAASALVHIIATDSASLS